MLRWMLRKPIMFSKKMTKFRWILCKHSMCDDKHHWNAESKSDRSRGLDIGIKCPELIVNANHNDNAFVCRRARIEQTIQPVVVLTFCQNRQLLKFSVDLSMIKKIFSSSS